VVDQDHEETLLEAVVGPALAGARLDQALASLFADYVTRSICMTACACAR
jgi:23S rRNA pseudouridine1911/1915/1917 synthase